MNDRDPSWRPSTREVDAASLPNVLASHRIVALHFWAVWNGVDRRFDETLRGLRDEFADRIFFGCFNTDDVADREFIRQCQVGNLPALACFVESRRIETLIGAAPIDELRLIFASWLRVADASHLAMPRISASRRMVGLFRRWLGRAGR